jgi:segregation and condensation protein B
LKPIKKNELNNTLTKICNNLSDNDTKIKEQRDMQNKLMNNRSNLRKHFANNVILKQDNLSVKDINYINDEYQLVTKPQNTNYLQKLLKTNTRQSLSQAALETLAIVAYKQPITRINIDEIRGVKSDRAVLTLLDRGLIKETSRLDVAGRPILYSTTDKFLVYFGLENLEQMPSLDEILSLDEVAVGREESDDEQSQIED